MPFTKGHTKAGGRKKGTPNTVDTTLRQFLADLLDRNRQSIIDDLAAIDDPAERLRILEKLMAYVIPKQQAVQASVDVDASRTLTIEQRLADLAAENEQ